MTSRGLTIGDLFDHCVATRPAATFLRTGPTAVSYREADERSTRIAGGLAAHGVRPHARVAVLSQNRVEVVLIWLACLRIGAVFCPLNRGFTASQLAAILPQISPAAVVADCTALPAARTALTTHGSAAVCFSLETDVPGWHPWSDLELDAGQSPRTAATSGDTAAFLCTSGTTGTSKAIGLSHRWFLKICETTEMYWRFSNADVFYCPFPLSHMDSLALTIVPALYHRTTAAISASFSVSRFWDEVRTYEATVFDYMGSTLKWLWDADPREDDADNPARLAWGVPRPEFAADFERRFDLQVTDCYGSTDVGVPVFAIPGEIGPAGSCGRVVDGYDVTIHSDAGLPLPVGEVGEIAVRAHEAYLIPETGSPGLADGWHNTRDLGRLDRNGYLYFIGRDVDSIRRRGENVSAYELEQIVSTHPAIQDVAAIGVPSETSEDEIKVVIALKDGRSLVLPDLARWVNDELPSFMHVRYIQIVDALPHTETQKVRKQELRDSWRTADTWDCDEDAFLSG